MATLRLTETSLLAIPAPTDRAQLHVWDSELRGFGCVIGKTTRSFVVRTRVRGELLKRTIGHLGQPRADGHLWSVKLARIEARKMLGAMADGRAPLTGKGERAAGPTLRKGLELHTANMRKLTRSPRSIETLENEVPRVLEEWMDRSIHDLTGAELVKIHDELTNAGKKFAANRVVAHVSTLWNALDRVHEFPGRNPARAVTRHRYVPSRQRIATADLSSWYTTVLSLPSPVRRDLQMFCLFTAMRSEAARHVRWEHIDEHRCTLSVPRPKGGQAKAFTLPLPKTIVEMLRKRRTENVDIFEPFGGDAGWVFPSMSRDGERVQPVAEPKEYRRDPTTKKKISILPGLHTLRRTYLSVAAEAHVSELDRSVLANHAYGNQTVNQTYISQSLEHLAECQAKIETALWSRIKS